MNPETYTRDDDERWRARAACRSEDGSVTAEWFPHGRPGRVKSISRVEAEFNQAQQCYQLECPVIHECRRFAVLTNQDRGVWGGLGFSDPAARDMARKEVYE